MTYKQILQKQIRELEEKIANQQGEKAELLKQLQRLQLSEFEEDERQNSGQQLLKG